MNLPYSCSLNLFANSFCEISPNKISGKTDLLKIEEKNASNKHNLQHLSKQNKESQHQQWLLSLLLPKLQTSS